MAVAATSVESRTALRKARRRRRRPDELPLAVSGPPQAGKKLGVAEVLALQKLLGNKATQEVLNKQAKDTSGIEETATEERFISKHVRETLKKQLLKRMTDASENYVKAWEAVRKDLAVEANFNPGFSQILVQTFLNDHGKLSKDLFKLVGNQFPILEGPGMDQPTLRGLDHAKEMKDFNHEHGEDPVEDAAQKVAKAAAALGSGTETRVIDAIKTGLRDLIQEIDDKDEEMTDVELLILWTNYDPALVKEELYKVLVRIIVGEAKRLRLAEQAKRRTGLGGGKGSKAAAATGDGNGAGDSNTKN